MKRLNKAPSLASLVLVACCWLSMSTLAVDAIAQTANKAMSASQALVSPDVEVSNARSEFISNDDAPRFTVVGIVVRGSVDTVSVVVHPSAIKSLDGKYRYKPKVVSIRRRDTLVEVTLELDGKGIPLPADSVRGSARLSVRGAGNFRGSRVRFESPRFEVFVANAAPVSPMILTNEMTVERIMDNTTGVFRIRGIRIRQSARKEVNGVLDTREPHLDSVYAVVESADVGEQDGGGRYKVLVMGPPRLTSGTPLDGLYEFTFKLAGGKFPLAGNRIKGSGKILFGVVVSHGGSTKRRVKSQPFTVSN